MSKASRRGVHRDMNKLRKQGLVRCKIQISAATGYLLHNSCKALEMSKADFIIQVLRDFVADSKRINLT